jgi:glc operon protein GlcG
MHPLLIAVSLLFVSFGHALPGAHGQVLSRPMLSLDGAKQVIAAAEAEAVRNDWTVAIAIVDAGGDLLLFHRRDGTQLASIDIAIGKAKTAARFRRPTKALEDAVLGGRAVLLALDDLTPLEGGVPIVIDGEVVGAIGVSGVTSQQDAVIAEAGVRAVTR